MNQHQRIQNIPKPPNFIVIFRDSRIGWFLLQKFEKVTDAFRAAEDGACIRAGTPQRPGLVYARGMFSPECEIPDRARRKLLGTDLRAYNWKLITRAEVSPHLFEEPRRFKTLGEVSRMFEGTETARLSRSRDITDAINFAMESIRWTPGAFFPRPYLWREPRLHEVSYASYLAQTGVPPSWTEISDVPMEVGNRISLDDLGEHTSAKIKWPHLCVLPELPKAPTIDEVCGQPEGSFVKFCKESRLRDAYSPGKCLHDSDPGEKMRAVDVQMDGLLGAARQMQGRVLRGGSPQAEWTDGHEADPVPLLPRLVEFMSGLDWGGFLWAIILGALTVCFVVALK